MTLPETIKFLRDLESRATEAKWLNGYPNACKITQMPDHIWTTSKELIAKDLIPDDAKFIAELRNTIKPLLDVAEKQHEALEFYACENNWHHNHEPEPCGEYSCAHYEKNHRATKAIAECEKILEGK